LKRLLYALIFSILVLSPILGRPAIYNVSAAEAPKVSPQLKIEAVRAYVTAEAHLYGVSTTQALWILDHESQDCQNLYGDDGQSIGCWMISRVYHPEVSDACAMDLTCSTPWSLAWIKSGHANQWSTWLCRYAWYPDATSTLGPAPEGYKTPKICKP
jgi:hypothetical protein